MLVNFVFRHQFEGLFHYSVGSLVAVMIRIFNELAFFVEQAEVHAPAIDADAGDIAICLFDRLCRYRF